MTRFMTRTFGPGIALLAPIGCGPADPPGAPDALRALTGAHTRVVWVQDAGPDSDPLSERSELRLVGLDSDDRRGERALLPEVSNYTKPMLTADGARVVYSDRLDRSVWVVDWEGSGRRKVCEGFAVDLWRDAASGIEWVYTVERFGDQETLPCRRRDLDDPARSELVWEGIEITWGWLSVSGDGQRAAATCRWPDTGLLDLSEPRWHRYRLGCWPDIAPDGSHLFWAFDGPHRGIHLLREGSRDSWPVDLSGAPGVEGLEIYHPRWSNHVRHLAISAPYTLGDDEIKLFKGGPQVEIYLGRFAPAYDRIETWARVSRNDLGDFWPDVWVAGGASARIPARVAAPAPDPAPRDAAREPGTRWPGDRSGLEFIWRGSLAANQLDALPGEPRRSCRVEPEGRARWGRFGVMVLGGGSCLAPGAGERLVTASRRSGELAIEALVTPGPRPHEGAATLLALSDGAAAAPLRLLQEQGVLYLELQGAAPEARDLPRIRLFDLPAARQTHLALSISAGEIRAFRDGSPQSVATSAAADPRSWTPVPLRFGDLPGGGSDWAGSIEGVAIYSRALGESEIAWQHDLYSSHLYRRKGTARYQLRGRLLRRSSTPDPGTLAPYRRALAVFVYQVDPADQPQLDAERILVAHWTILDGRRLPELADRTTGTLYELEIEPFDDHRELSSERILMEGLDPSLPLFCDVGELQVDF